MKKAGKKYRIIYKVLIFDQTYLKFYDCHDKVKTVGGALDIKTSAENKWTVTESFRLWHSLVFFQFKKKNLIEEFASTPLPCTSEG